MRVRYDDKRLPRRFWDNIVADGRGCWHWHGAIRKPQGGRQQGYGAIRVGGKTLLAHRFAYESVAGPILPGLQVDHLCRVRGCVNPRHMELVTTQENTRRGNVGRYERKPRGL